MAVRGARKKTAEKEHYHHGDLRQALLEASLTLIAEEGFGALTLREVARRAGVTHAAPYRHFADKQALLAAVAEEGYRAMAARMREDMARETSPAKRLEACGVAYVLFAVDNAAHFRVMFGPHFTRAEPPVEHSDGEPGSFTLLMGAILEGQRVGLVREGDPQALALTCWSLVHGLASLWVDRQLGSKEPRPGIEALTREQTNLLMCGLARGPVG